MAVQLAYTLLDARYTDGFLACTTTPCAAPATPSRRATAFPASRATRCRPSWGGRRRAAGARASGCARRAGSEVNDTNTDAAASFVVANVSAGYVLPLGAWNFSAFARVDNVTDRRTVGSVIVNEGNGRYFEPAPGRSWTVGVAATVGF